MMCKTVYYMEKMLAIQKIQLVDYRIFQILD
jgi:hypothetical protein